MKYYLLLCVLVVGCRKKDNPVPVPTVQSIVNDIGLKWEHRYKISPADGQIVFHENQTITEYNNTDSQTYAATYIISTNNSTSILKDGKALKIYINTPDWSSKFSFYATASGYTNDTTVIGTYLSGAVCIGTTPTLGATYPVWKNKVCQFTE